jgi:triphosphoribosyl-dephospho-CoA synthetase
MKPSFAAPACLAALIVLAGAPAWGAEDSTRVSHAECVPQAEVAAEVPALTAFHDVIFELWHGAWPEKNTALMKELLPRVQNDFAAVEEAALPGILRDKQAAWDAGIKEMKAAIADYEKAVASADDKALLDAVETLHMKFERQMRVIRPYLRELEDYHVFLYQIYHHFAPSHNLEMLSGSVDSLTVRCVPLASAPPPRWFKGDAENLGKEIDRLCDETGKLEKAAAAADWKEILEAVDAVHEQYVKVLSQFEAS